MLAAKQAATTFTAAASPADIGGLALAVEELVKSGSVKVPMLPQVATQVLQAASDDKCDAARLSGLIHKDPALAGRVLKIANSPLYMAKSPLVSLQQAVARLGFATLTEIALAASVESGVFAVPGFEHEIQALWHESLATAAFAKEIARLRRLNVETAFLCGLLADIGRPVVLQAVVDLARKQKLSTGAPEVRACLLDLASRFAGATTQSVVKAWQLPAAVQAAASHRDEPAAAGPHVKDAAIAGAARWLALNLLHPSADAVPLHEQGAFVLLNLYRDDAAALVAKGDAVKKAVLGLAS